MCSRTGIRFFNRGRVKDYPPPLMSRGQRSLGRMIPPRFVLTTKTWSAIPWSELAGKRKSLLTQTRGYPHIYQQLPRTLPQGDVLVEREFCAEGVNLAGAPGRPLSPRWAPLPRRLSNSIASGTIIRKAGETFGMKQLENRMIS